MTKTYDELLTELKADFATPVSRLEAVLAEYREFPKSHTVMVDERDLRLVLDAFDGAQRTILQLIQMVGERREAAQ